MLLKVPIICLKKLFSLLFTFINFYQHKKKIKKEHKIMFIIHLSKQNVKIPLNNVINTNVILIYKRWLCAILENNPEERK